MMPPIGGPDANSVTHAVSSRLAMTIRFGDPAGHEVALRDTLTAKVFSPDRADSGDDIVRDYGVVVRAKNPFALPRAVVVLAGSFGYGTWGAAKFATSDEFLANKDVKQGATIECLIETDVVKDSAVVARPIVLRALGQGPPNPGLPQSGDGAARN